MPASAAPRGAGGRSCFGGTPQYINARERVLLNITTLAAGSHGSSVMPERGEVNVEKRMGELIDKLDELMKKITSLEETINRKDEELLQKEIQIKCLLQKLDEKKNEDTKSVMDYSDTDIPNSESDVEMTEKTTSKRKNHDSTEGDFQDADSVRQKKRKHQRERKRQAAVSKNSPKTSQEDESTNDAKKEAAKNNGTTTERQPSAPKSAGGPARRTWRPGQNNNNEAPKRNHDETMAVAVGHVTEKSQTEQPQTEKPKDTPAAEGRKEKEVDPTTVKPKRERIAPITIEDKGAGWTHISKWIDAQKDINYSRAKNTEKGIEILPTTAYGYRTILRYMAAQNILGFANQLQEEKELKIVIRGVPVEQTENDVGNDLLDKGFHPTMVTRMKRMGGIPMPLVLVSLPRGEKEIFNLREVLCLRVRVETLRTRAKVSQCHRCQQFGHGQSRCTLKPKCVRCAGEHHTVDCLEPREGPRKCSNCDGDHAANYSQCPRRPRMAPKRELPPRTPAWRDPNKRLLQDETTRQTIGDAQNTQFGQMLDAMSAMSNIISSFQESFQNKVLPLMKTFTSIPNPQC